MNLAHFKITQGDRHWIVIIDEDHESHFDGLRLAINRCDPPMNFQSPPFVQPEFYKPWSIISGSIIIGQIEMLAKETAVI